jgi:hypothetical protein
VKSVHNLIFYFLNPILILFSHLHLSISFLTQWHLLCGFLIPFTETGSLKNASKSEAFVCFCNIRSLLPWRVGTPASTATFYSTYIYLHVLPYIRRCNLRTPHVLVRRESSNSNENVYIVVKN